MSYQIRFNGSLGEGIFREAFVVQEWPDNKDVDARKEWDSVYSKSPESYEFLHLAGR